MQMNIISFRIQWFMITTLVRIIPDIDMELWNIIGVNDNWGEEKVYSLVAFLFSVEFPGYESVKDEDKFRARILWHGSERGNVECGAE